MRDVCRALGMNDENQGNKRLGTKASVEVNASHRKSRKGTVTQRTVCYLQISVKVNNNYSTETNWMRLAA